MNRILTSSLLAGTMSFAAHTATAQTFGFGTMGFPIAR